MDSGARKTGEVSRLIMVHGWGFDATTWDPLRSILDHHVVTEAYDLAGFGEHVSGSGEVPGFEEHVVELIDYIAASDEPVVLIGHSRGGAIALAAAARDDGMVEGVITIGSAARFSPGEDYPWGLEKEQLKQIASQFRSDFTGTFKSFLGAFWLNDIDPSPSSRDAALLVGAATRHRRPEVVAEILASDAEIDVLPLLKEIEVPVLVLQGTRDAVVPEEAARWLVQQLPRGEFHSIEGAGHVPHVTRPDATAAAILEFIDVLSAGRSV